MESVGGITLRACNYVGTRVRDSALRVKDYFTWREARRMRVEMRQRTDSPPVAGSPGIHLTGAAGANVGTGEASTETKIGSGAEDSASAGGNGIAAGLAAAARSAVCLLYTSPSPRDGLLSRMPSSA